MKSSIIELVQQDPVVRRCYQEGIARKLNEHEFLELAVESLAKWKAEAIAREIAKAAESGCWIDTTEPGVIVPCQ